MSVMTAVASSCVDQVRCLALYLYTEYQLRTRRSVKSLREADMEAERKRGGESKCGELPWMADTTRRMLHLTLSLPIPFNQSINQLDFIYVAALRLDKMTITYK